MRVRIYLQPSRGTGEEAHLDWNPPVRSIIDSTVDICVGARFTVATSELIKAARVLEKLDELHT